jgi:hypothetical protein
MRQSPPGNRGLAIIIDVLADVVPMRGVVSFAIAISLVAASIILASLSRRLSVAALPVADD